MPNNERVILPLMAEVGGNTKITWAVSKMLADTLDKQQFAEFEQWVPLAKAKQHLFEQRGKRFGF